MNIKTFLSSMDHSEKEAFAKSAGTSLAYLLQLSSGHRRAGLKTILAIEDASGGKVTGRDLRPDLYRGAA